MKERFLSFSCFSPVLVENFSYNERKRGRQSLGNKYNVFEKLVSSVIDVLLGLLIIVVLVVMGEAIFTIITHVIPLATMEELSVLIEEVATLFILLEIILMLLRYVKEGHHIPVRYLILISITAILRELLLAQGDGVESLFLSIAILVLVLVLVLLEKIKAFHKSGEEEL
ncbi:phosphate-starvation-inducible PsiE family protein [Enterococcus sp. 669A]|uniref:Protein PsiE n=1 Tax=Candidatus Enterococcus moelleringii TaxID=2815325 RepID=A0ABS3L6F1_9ENTE|nr:phosphate-starvation-inducible PsiE family protein [Enterococcus sp. 669A]MBO1305165.1 phosphate-starvation-inducible PsiE family protein [Enterococcus sp. 669A]